MQVGLGFLPTAAFWLSVIVGTLSIATGLVGLVMSRLRRRPPGQEHLRTLFAGLSVAMLGGGLVLWSLAAAFRSVYPVPWLLLAIVGSIGLVCVVVITVVLIAVRRAQNGDHTR